MWGWLGSVCVGGVGIWVGYVGEGEDVSLEGCGCGVCG